MSKNIVFCADGTWNGPPTKAGEVDASDGDDDAPPKITNVVKLFENLAGAITAETAQLRNEREKVLAAAAGVRAQIAKYIHGVGDSSAPIRRVIGGAFGAGVIARVVRGYTFLSRNYEDGDDIFVLGFSRGAYTARALAGMIARVGLLEPGTYDPEDKEEAYGLGVAAWQKYRREALADANRVTQATNALLDFVQHFHARPLSDDGLRDGVPMKVVAVWDTVGSLGVPVYDLALERMDVFQFADNELSDKVQFGLHAMSIDELRSDFPITEWKPRAGVEQVWFAGAHSDVGGGYPDGEAVLSDEALGWMMRKLAAKGVQFANPLPFPPRVSTGNEAVHHPWENVPFSLRKQAQRNVGADSTLHCSVIPRFSSPAGYAPLAMKQALQQQSFKSFAVDNTRW